MGRVRARHGHRVAAGVWGLLTAGLIALAIGIPCGVGTACRLGGGPGGVLRSGGAPGAGAPTPAERAAAFRRSIVATAYRGISPGGAGAEGIARLIAPTGCRIARERGGTVILGPAATGALTCQVVLSWAPHPAAAAYETRVSVGRPCARARGSRIGARREVLGVVTSPFYRCAITYRVIALARSGPWGALAPVDSTYAFAITARWRSLP